jgi:hypothetical protein
MFMGAHAMFCPPPLPICGLMSHDHIIYIPRGQLDLEVDPNVQEVINHVSIYQEGVDKGMPII